MFAFLPNRDWTRSLVSSRLLDSIGLFPFAQALREGLDATFRHAHLQDGEGWSRIFRDAGFEIDGVDPIGSAASTVAFELSLLPSLLGRTNKALTGRWTLWPGLRRLTALPVYAAVRAILALADDSTPTAEFLVCAHRPGP